MKKSIGRRDHGPHEQSADAASLKSIMYEQRDPSDVFAVLAAKEKSREPGNRVFVCGDDFEFVWPGANYP